MSRGRHAAPDRFAPLDGSIHKFGCAFGGRGEVAMPAITSIINVHAEGSMACGAIESMLAAADFAAARGVHVETFVVADRVTRDTIEAMRPYQQRIRIEHANV